MKTKQQINADILTLTMTIRKKYPELMKYIAEMPVTIPDVITPQIDSKILLDYFQSLETMLKKYAPNHFANNN